MKLDFDSGANGLSGQAGHAHPRASRAADGLILDPGRNCVAVANADKAAVLVDGSNYFTALESALHQARRGIVILCWDFDGRIRLRHDAPESESPPLGQLLRSLVEKHEDLSVHILIWSVSLLHAPGNSTQLVFGAEWQKHPRIHLKLDTRHPVYGAHHQKIVAIDDSIAFLGGIDLTVRRWDTPDHRPANPLRTDPDGVEYHPVHDLQMVVTGDAAEAVAGVARQRWRDSGEPELPPRGRRRDIWPEGLEADFARVPVAVARTAPKHDGLKEIREAARLTVDALWAARRTIYIEAQYLTASLVGAVLARKLRAADGPEVVIVVTRDSDGFI
ncbi:MAG: hypothetical protein AB7L41_15795, partial [Flavobacteriaceae bacterium]